MEYKDIDISTYQDPPQANVVFVLGDAGYTLETAIDEIIDNSISAGASNIKIDFIYDGLNSSIKIQDDGKGMTSEELHNAMKYAFLYSSDRNLSDLGRFGVGLKTSSSSVCNVLYVATCKNDLVCCTKIDYREWQKSNDFIYHVIKKHDDDIFNKDGTIVTWANLKLEKDDIANKNILLNKRLFTNKIDSVRSHISLIYGRCIDNGLNIKIGNDSINIPSFDPFYREKSERRINSSVNVPGRNPFRIEGFILPKFQSLNEVEQNKIVFNKENLVQLQGLYIYRNNRLISYGGWCNLSRFKISEKSQYARIGLYFDNSYDKYIDLTFTKTGVRFPNELVSVLSDIIEGLVEESRRKTNSQVKAKKNREIGDPVWKIERTKIGIKLSINENQSLIKELTSSLPIKDRKLLFGLLSKEVPVGDLQNYGFKKLDDSYSEDEINELLLKKFYQYKLDNLDVFEIKQKIIHERPFSEYLDIVNNFFKDKEEK